MRGEAAIGIDAGMGVGMSDGITAGGGATGAASGADIAAVGDIDGGGGAVGKAVGPPDIIFENAIGSNPGGICIPAAFAADTISAAVGSTVPVMKLYPGGPEEVVGALTGAAALLAASLTA
jgi:hypothetical protein